MTELALKRGHKVTFFNRGKTNADLFPEIERITGDRNGEIDGLKGRKWDAVIDNSGYFPRAGETHGRVARAIDLAVSVRLVDQRVSGLQSAARRRPPRSAS